MSYEPETFNVWNQKHVPPFNWHAHAGVMRQYDSLMQSMGEMLAKEYAQRAEEILRGWFREELGDECPVSAEDIITVATAKGYTVLRIVPRTGDTDTLALMHNGTTIRSIGLRRF